MSSAFAAPSDAPVAARVDTSEAAGPADIDRPGDAAVRPLLADAVDLARAALLDLGDRAVGVHLGVTREDDAAATHRFKAELPGYRGWQWVVVVAAPPEADHATVSELALLPGPEALVPPPWVPWNERIRPGDLGPGDLLAPLAGDPRLTPAYDASGDPVVDEAAREVGLGRSQVMSLEGRLDAAERWRSGETGPDSEMAKLAVATCATCGFYLPLAGSLRAAFGVCGNELAADGRVVHAEHGCGAHSDTLLPTGAGSPTFDAYDDGAIELVEHPVDPAAMPARETESGAVADAPSMDARSTDAPSTQTDAPSTQ